MEKKKWIEVARRGKAQPVLVIDSAMEGYIAGLWEKFHQTNWYPKSYRQFDNTRWFGAQDYAKYQIVLEKASTSKKITLLIYAETYRKLIDSHKEFGKRWSNTDFAKFPNKKLADIFESWFEHPKKFWCFAYDYIFINKFLPNRVTAAVEAKLTNKEELNHILSVIFNADTPSEQQLEKKNILKIAKWIKENKIARSDKHLKTKLLLHLKHYAHLGYYYFRGTSYTEESLQTRLSEYLSFSEKQFQETIDQFGERNNAQETARLVKHLGLDEQTIKFIIYLKRWASISNYVDETFGFVVHHLSPLWKEICNRLGITYKQFYSLTGREIIEALRAGYITSNLKKELTARHNDHALILEGKRKRMLVGHSLDVYRAQEEVIKEDYSHITELKGQSASPGSAKGVVRLIFTTHDVAKVERGNILVANSTNPTYVPAMERAVAIITDEGGLLSHAAIVSRELKVPCVVGTKIGTKVLKDGDLIEVDADKGIVKIIKKI